MPRHGWYKELIYYAEHGVIEEKGRDGNEWVLTDMPNFGDSYYEYRIPRTKLYQARVEIPRPLTVEEAREIAKAEPQSRIYLADPTASLNYPLFSAKNYEAYATLINLGLAYHNFDEVKARSKAMLKIEEEK